MQKVFAKNRQQTLDLLWNVNKMKGKKNALWVLTFYLAVDT